MRLFDKLASQGPATLRDAFRKLPESFAVVRIDSIADDYATNPKLLWSSSDYPYFRLPWKQCFFEWREPKLFVTDQGIIESSGQVQLGVMAISLKEGRAAAAFARMQPHTTASVESMRLPDDATCGMMLSFSMATPKEGVTVPNVLMMVATTKDGLVRRRAITGSGCQHWIDRLGQESVERHFDSQMHVVALACTFANCKNVSMVDASSYDKPTEKIRRRLKLPEVKWYTLKIDGKAVARSDGGDGQSGQPVSYHLCRGHFATYTEEKPLFGRLVGRYWIPPHTRGNKDRGIVVKEYATGNDRDDS